MRYREGMISTAAALVLSLTTLAGIALSDQAPQNAYADSVGFDALANRVFGDQPVLCADATPKKVAAQ